MKAARTLWYLAKCRHIMQRAAPPVITSNLMHNPKNTKIKPISRQNAEVQETQGMPITRKVPYFVRNTVVFLVHTALYSNHTRNTSQSIRFKNQPNYKCRSQWRRIQTLPRRSLLPKCHSFSTYTCTCNLTYASKESTAFPASTFTKLDNAQQHQRRSPYTEIHTDPTINAEIAGVQASS